MVRGERQRECRLQGFYNATAPTTSTPLGLVAVAWLAQHNPDNSELLLLTEPLDNFVFFSMLD